MKIIYSLSIALFLTFTMFGQEVFNPDKYAFDCYSEVTMPEKSRTLYIYDGIDPNIEIEEVTVMLKNGKTKWEKRKADRNCLSANPEDCLVWCQVEDSTPMIYDVVIDTSTTEEWYPYKYIVRKEGQKIITQVLCKNELSKELLYELKNKLYKLGYDVKPDKTYKKLKGKFMREFKQFQEDYGLPVGKWTLESMEFLYKSKLN